MNDTHLNDRQKDWLRLFFQTDSISVEPLTPDASKRRYYRISANKHDSYVLCAEEGFSPWQHPFLVQRHLWCQHQLPVPKVIAFSGELGLILLEDLGNTSLQSLWAEPNTALWGSDHGSIFAPAPVIALPRRLLVTEKIVGDLCRIQSLPVASFEYQFDRSKLGFEWGWTFKYLIQPLLSYERIKRDVRDRLFHYWSEWTYEVSLYLEENISVPCHRDFHSRNIMIFEEQHYFIDFQDARLGTIYYDLSSFVFDAYLKYDRLWEQQVIDCYHSLSRRPWDERLFGVQAMQRLFKAAGSFASFYVRQKDKRYLGYLPQTLNLLKVLAYDRGYGGPLAQDFSPLLDDLHEYWSLNFV